jgi:hypothetical protein
MPYHATNMIQYACLPCIWHTMHPIQLWSCSIPADGQLHCVSALSHKPRAVEALNPWDYTDRTLAGNLLT